MHAVLLALLRVAVGAVISLLAFQLLFAVFVRIGAALGLTAPGGPELVLSALLAVALAWLAVRRIPLLWATGAAADEIVDP